MDAVHPLFSTMDMVMKFSPTDGALGDEDDDSEQNKVIRLKGGHISLSKSCNSQPEAASGQDENADANAER